MYKLIFIALVSCAFFPEWPKAMFSKTEVLLHELVKDLPIEKRILPIKEDWLQIDTQNAFYCLTWKKTNTPTLTVAIFLIKGGKNQCQI